MRRILVVVGLVAAWVVGCSSGPDVSTPAAACTSALTAQCNKVGSCSGANVQTCINVAQDAGFCANAACPTGTTYNSANAATCINNYSAQSCADAIAGVTPPGCTLAAICP